MLFGVYAMRDNVSALYNQPTFEISDEIAKRSFRYAINSTDFLKFNAKDVDLFKIGEFENTTGVFTPCMPEKLIDGVACVESE